MTLDLQDQSGEAFQRGGRHMARRPLIVGVGGTTRDGSSCEAALRYALRCAAEMGAEVVALTGSALQLPIYDPQSGHRTPEAVSLVHALRRADGVLIASPGYHGLISGMLKNALDYTEDMRGDARPYLDGRAVGCIVSANGAQALGSTLASLRSMIHALRGWPTPFGATLVAGQTKFELDAPVDQESRAALGLVARQVVDFARMSVAWSQPQPSALPVRRSA